MNKTSLTALLLVAAVGFGTTAALAQEGQHATKKSDQAPAAMESNRGETSSTPAGQGGTAGTHPTGANVGPGRAGEVKTPGN
jgi:hypothetical protein